MWCKGRSRSPPYHDFWNRSHRKCRTLIDNKFFLMAWPWSNDSKLSHNLPVIVFPSNLVNKFFLMAWPWLNDCVPIKVVLWWNCWKVMGTSHHKNCLITKRQCGNSGGVGHLSMLWTLQPVLLFITVKTKCRKVAWNQENILVQGHDCEFWFWSLLPLGCSGTCEKASAFKKNWS